MSAVHYSLGIGPRNPAHIEGLGGKTLCGLEVRMFGRPLREDEVALHVPCRACARAAARVEATVSRWRERKTA